ncbi:hypothetical protein DFH11DRAFT_1464060, partial [Phellopilus nigrolimitatus]
PGTSYGTPPLTPQTRQLNIFITVDPIAAPRRNAAPKPLKRFTGCLARPETVFTIDESTRPIVLADTEPSVVFTSRDPMSASSVTTVWVEAPAEYNGRGSPLGGLGVSTGGIGMTMKKVHRHRQPLVCTQHPTAMASSATQTFYSIDNIDDSQIRPTRNTHEQQESFVYKTNLVEDAVWNTLFRERGYSRCTITQDLICNFDNSVARRGETFLSIAYHLV